MKKFLSITLALLLCLTVLSACGGEDAATTTDTASGEPAAEGETVAPISSKTIVLDGKEYELPVAVSDLLADGWTIAEDELAEEYEAGALEDEGGSTAVKKSDSDKFFIRGVKNPDTESAKPLSECQISAIQITFSVAADTTVVLPGGATEKSTYDEVLEAYGDPESTTDFARGRKDEKQLAYDNQNDSGYSYSFNFEDGNPSSFIITAAE